MVSYLVNMDILQLIREELKGISTTKKTKFGQGMEHIIYPSKNHPDRLFKIGEEYVVGQWVKVFRSNPEVFPKIYRVGKISDPRDKRINGYYVEIEKLDTDKAIKEWEQLEDKLEECGIVDFEDGAFGRDMTDIYINYEEDQKTITHIATKLKECDIKGYDLFIKWFKLFKECQKSIEKVVGHGTLVDAHRYNFGYGSDGKLKCLDI
jgi:hypothetical protein